jgi:hypothetical protein
MFTVCTASWLSLMGVTLLSHIVILFHHIWEVPPNVVVGVYVDQSCETPWMAVAAGNSRQGRQAETWRAGHACAGASEQRAKAGCWEASERRAEAQGHQAAC